MNGIRKRGVPLFLCDKTRIIHFFDDRVRALPGLLGDVNGDGMINGVDSGLLLQYLAEWEVEIDQTAADVNGDGMINGIDSGLLLQYLAEWFEEFPAA